jgi:hypothetical protein
MVKHHVEWNESLIISLGEVSFREDNRWSSSDQYPIARFPYFGYLTCRATGSQYSHSSDRRYLTSRNETDLEK